MSDLNIVQTSDAQRTEDERARLAAPVLAADGKPVQPQEWYVHADGIARRAIPYTEQGKPKRLGWNSVTDDFTHPDKAVGPFTHVTRENRPHLTLRRRVTISVEQTIDPVAVFENLPAGQRAFYMSDGFEQEVRQYGLTQSWERPLALLYGHEPDVGMGVFPSSKGYGRERVDTDDDDLDVDHRPPGLPRPDGRRVAWTEDDFDWLLTKVPWLAKYHLDAGDTTITAEDVARIPGPNDLPLFG